MKKNLKKPLAFLSKVKSIDTEARICFEKDANKEKEIKNERKK